MRHTFPTCGRLGLLSLLMVVTCAVRSEAQKAPPAPQPDPQAPKLDIPVPLGVQRGSGLELTLTGSNLAEPLALWTSFPARATFPTDANNGKDNAKLRVRLEVPVDAPLGFHSLRLATTRGISNARVFCIDELPQLKAPDGHRTRATAPLVPVPSVVVGRADVEASDFYRIHARAGERLSFEVLGRRLGSLFDPQLTLYDARSGRELPGGHNNDAPGLQTDARLTYVFKQAGDYLVEVRDVTWRGGPDFWYRLRIGDFPCATTPLPMAVRRGTQRTVTFAGSQVDGVAPVEVLAPTDPRAESVTLVPRGPNGHAGWPVTLALSDHDELLEQEPNNEPARANRVPVPGGITARFQQTGDVDHFMFAGRKGQRYIIDAQTLELGSPTEVYLAVKDAKGNQVAASNPTAGPRIDFTAPADGDFTIVAEHLLYWSGPTETYHLTIEPYQPDFTLSLGIDRFNVPPGGVVPLTLLATRRDYNGPIHVEVASPGGMTGTATIPAGAPAPNQPAATLYLCAAGDVPPGPYDLVLRGTATVAGKTLMRYVSLKALTSQNLAGLPFPPAELSDEVALGVTEKPPFTLTAHFDQRDATRGVSIPVTVIATRSAGFVDEITLSAAGLPANVTVAAKPIAKGQTTARLDLTAAAAAALGEVAVSISGKAKQGNKEFHLSTLPIAVTLVNPFDLSVAAVPAKLMPGTSAKLKVTAVRHGGYQGPIGLEVRNLPAGVTAAKATIPANQNSGEIDVKAADGAKAATKADVNILGTATGAANQQVASPAFAVAVAGK